MKYSEYQIDKAMSMVFEEKKGEYYVDAKSDKESFKYKLKVGNSTIPICNCWWFTYRTRSNVDKFGICSHSLGWFWNYNKQMFWSIVSEK